MVRKSRRCLRFVSDLQNHQLRPALPQKLSFCIFDLPQRYCFGKSSDSRQGSRGSWFLLASEIVGFSIFQREGPSNHLQPKELQSSNTARFVSSSLVSRFLRHLRSSEMAVNLDNSNEISTFQCVLSSTFSDSNQSADSRKPTPNIWLPEGSV